MPIVYKGLDAGATGFWLEALRILYATAFLPLTYVVNLLGGQWTESPWGNHLPDTGVLAVMLLLGVIVSARTFRRE